LARFDLYGKLKSRQDLRLLCPTRTGDRRLIPVSLLRKQRRRRIRPANESMDIRCKRQIVPRAADIEAKIWTCLICHASITSGHGNRVQVKPALTDIHIPSKRKRHAGIFKLTFLDAGDPAGKMKTGGGMIESGPSPM
jgi:ribosomal protein L37AE/L43A